MCVVRLALYSSRRIGIYIPTVLGCHLDKLSLREKFQTTDCDSSHDLSSAQATLKSSNEIIESSIPKTCLSLVCAYVERQTTITITTEFRRFMKIIITN